MPSLHPQAGGDPGKECKQSPSQRMCSRQSPPVRYRNDSEVSQEAEEVYRHKGLVRAGAVALGSR